MNDQNQVEIDTDDVNEENVTVQEKPKEEKPEKIDVDLGYTDPIATDTKAKVVEDEANASDTGLAKTDNLEDVSQNVQKRIDKLTRKYREAERREKAALDYAKGLQAKYSNIEKQQYETDKTFVEEYDARIAAEREQVKASMKQAIQDNDADKIMECNDKLTNLSVEKAKADIKKKEIEKKEKEQQAVAEQPQQQIPQPTVQPSAKATRWAEENEWFGNDRDMTSTVLGIHENLIKEGFDPESDEYYNEIDKQMRDNYPTKFASEKRPIQTVASAGRKQQGRRTVKLTRSQVAIAKKLGVPLEEYAKHVKE